MEPLLCRLRDEGANLALCDVPSADPLTARVSPFADDVTVYVSCRLKIKAVKKVVSEYERIAGAKVNFDKSEGLQLGTWRDSDTLPEPFRWSNRPVRILRVCFGSTGSGGCSGGNLASKEVVLKELGGGVRRVHLPLDPLPISCISSA